MDKIRTPSGTTFLRVFYREYKKDSKKKYLFAFIRFEDKTTAIKNDTVANYQKLFANEKTKSNGLHEKLAHYQVNRQMANKILLCHI
jgi:hypothetical protein